MELARKATVHPLATRDQRRAPRDASIVDRIELRGWVSEWRREVYEEAADEHGAGALRLVVLRRANERRPRALLTLQIDEDKDTDAIVKRLADVAERYADNVAPGEHVAFEVCGFYGSEAVPRALEHIGLVGEEPEGSDAGGVSSAKPTEIVRAVVEHARNVLAFAEKKEARATKIIQEALDAAHDEIKDLRKQTGDLFLANMTLADHAAEREALVTKAKADVEFKREAGKTALALLPAAINRISIANGGTALLPEGVHPLLAQLSNMTVDLADEGLQQDLMMALSKHGAKGQRLMAGIGELMVQTATINAAAEAAAKAGADAKAEAARLEQEQKVHEAEPVKPNPPPYSARAPWL